MPGEPGDVRGVPPAGGRMLSLCPAGGRESAALVPAAPCVALPRGIRPRVPVPARGPAAPVSSAVARRVTGRFGAPGACGGGGTRGRRGMR